jgi:hypothetical protein
MRVPLRQLIVYVALVAAGGCAGKRPPAEDTPPPAPPPPTASSATPPASASASSPPRRAQTSEERQAALDKQLNDSLDSFDAQLIKEQQKVAQERDARQTAIATVAADTSTDSSIPKKRGTVRAERPGDLKSDKSAGANNTVATGNGAMAAETPDGSDDDIIARRLRTAAEQETDPELKDRLWQEYVEYKKNSQVR